MRTAIIIPLLAALPTLLAAPRPLRLARDDDDYDYEDGKDYSTTTYDDKTYSSTDYESYTETYDDKWKTYTASSYEPTLTIGPESPSATEVREPNPVIAADLLERIIDAPTVVDRFTIIFNETRDNQDLLVFDFNPGANPAIIPGRGGQAVGSNKKNFPILTNLGVSTTVGFLNPCGLNTPHTHPRASEQLTVVTPVACPVRSGFILENGFTMEFATNLTQYESTVFPQGSIHYQFNDNCEPAVFVAALSSDDPGVSSIAQNFFALDGDIVDSALGFPFEISGLNIEDFRAIIPRPFAIAVTECLDRCGIKY
ncbi:hypothetical protein CI109_105427 [Kwoniella shandongensis]|uniref:Uncharacterized protein n=1 Tax=Kwoniella shandongensis TaxID=1734106 RepID=A0A5M6C2A8_9TREE|nr:uncharacterized protein CI109_002148 [Kwoniella shandongensis]KAA5529258.1 hypothetical protein CI109_002148 [Kwoniella shandongensis]